MSESDRRLNPAGASACVAVLYERQENVEACRTLAQRLAVPLINSDALKEHAAPDLLLCQRDGKLCLLDRHHLKKGGLAVEFEVHNQQRSWPAPKTGPLARAIGRKTRTVVDATAGWGQDSFFIFRMGYQVLCIERSAVMAELLKDGLLRLSNQSWMQRLAIEPPGLLVGNAIELLNCLDYQPDCIYLDPMFPPKRKKSALARKSMALLRELLGDDEDRVQLFQAALKAAGKRVVVKSPEYAESLGGKADESFKGKLVRYDVYLK